MHENVGGGIAFDSGPYTHAGPENITVRNNLIVNNTYTPDKWSAAVAFSSDYSSGMTCSAKIYDNIIWNPALTRGIYMTAYKAPNDCDVDINNNVIRAKGAAIYATSNLATMRINNNILISNDSDVHVVLYDTTTSITNHTANIYYRMDGSPSLVTRKGITYTTSTLRTWEPTAYASNPNFKNAASIPTGFLPDNTPNTDGLSILSGDAINNGTILGSPYNIAINNVFRGTKWDIGPYTATTVVNHAPVLTAIGNKTTGAGSPLIFTVNATDPDSNTLTYSAANLPANATFTPELEPLPGTDLRLRSCNLYGNLWGY